MNYSYTRKINLTFEEALDEVRFAFTEKGFGVVSNINISEKIRKKVDSDFGEYVVLGLCNPNIAYKYLSSNMDFGIFMPCSVAIYEKNDGIYISCGLPEGMMGGIDLSDDLLQVTSELTSSMKEIIDSI